MAVLERLENTTVVSQEEWLVARKALWAREKEFTHLRDKINAERLALPRVKVEKEYVFETPQGKKKLADLFAGRSQLMTYHFMLGPGWDAGCPGCSFFSDHVDGALPHLEHHDVTMVAVSRAPLAEIEAYKRRMEWGFPWVSSFGSDFNYDYHVSFSEDELASDKMFYNYTESPIPAGFNETETELPGLSAFSKDEAGVVYHTYSTYARGLEEMVGALMILDRAPKGRNESRTMDFVRRHDEYEGAPKAHACCAD
jgi:predicted dithiol-disulfide oxidoreductase (DUF899 family)